MKESIFELRARRMRESLNNFSEQDRLSLGISLAAKRILIDAVEGIERGAMTFKRRRIAGGSE